MMSQQKRVQLLEKSYQYVKRYILSHQSATTGLFPTYLKLYEHNSDMDDDDDNGTWVLDNIHTIISVWALSVGYRKVDDDDGRTYELQQSVVKCMRGILSCYMRETLGNVEAFKLTQDPKYALSMKYNYVNGDRSEDEEGHRLSIYTLSLFIFYLAQFTKSGLRIIFTLDEVDFVQNLVYGIERAYRTPDYSVWDRGEYGNGTLPVTTLKASSIGMAKAALEAVSGMNVFGLTLQGSGGFVYVDPDALNRNRAIFTSMLPRESAIQETDVLLLTVVGWPAYTCSDQELSQETEGIVHEELRGAHGYELTNRNNSEVDQKEYPVAFVHLLINALMKADGESLEIAKYLELIEDIQIETGDGAALIPEMYCHPLTKTKKKCEVVRMHTLPTVLTANASYQYGVETGLLHGGTLETSSIGHPTLSTRASLGTRGTSSASEHTRSLSRTSRSSDTISTPPNKHTHSLPRRNEELTSMTAVFASDGAQQLQRQSHGHTQQHRGQSYTTHTRPQLSPGENAAYRKHSHHFETDNFKGVDDGQGRKGYLYEDLGSGKARRRLRSHDHIMHHLHTRGEVLADAAVVPNFDPVDYSDWRLAAQGVPEVQSLRRSSGASSSRSSMSAAHRRASNPRLLESKLSLTPKLVQPSDSRESIHKHAGHLTSNDKYALHHQSLWLVSQLLLSQVVSPSDLDPQHRRLRPRNAQGPRGWHGEHEKTHVRKKSDIVVQVALLAENERLQAVLGTYGISTQTQQQIEPIHICSPSTLIELYSHLGKNRKFRLSGRPNRPCGSLTTSKVYVIRAQTFVFYPILLDHTDFYMSLDLQLLIDKIKDELTFLAENWSCESRPLMCLLITENMVADDFLPEILELMASLKRGECNGITIKMGRLQQVISTSQKEHLEFLSAPEFDSVINATAHQDFILPRLLPDRRESISSSRQSSTNRNRLENDLEDTNLNSDEEAEEMLKAEDINYNEMGIGMLTTALKECNELVAQAGILTSLYTRKGMDFNALGDNGTVSSLLDEVYEMAGSVKLWSVIRQVSGIKKKVADSLAPAVTEMLVRGKDVVIGVDGEREFIINEPIAPSRLTQGIFEHCPDFREAVLQQEIISYLAPFIVSMPELFDHMLRIRLGSLIEAMKSDLFLQHNLSSRRAATAKLMTLSPFAVKCLLKSVLEDVDECPCVNEQFKLLHIRVSNYQESLYVDEHGPNCTWTNGRWLHRRYRLGLLGRINPVVYDRTFEILDHCEGICIGNVSITKPDSPDKVEYYQMFENAFNSINRPEGRAMCMELLNVMWMVFVQRVPELNLPYTIHLHRLIDHAVSMFMSDHKVTEGSYTVLPGGIVEEFVNGLAQQNREQYTQQKGEDGETIPDDPNNYVGVERVLDEHLLRAVFAEESKIEDIRTGLAPEHRRPTAPFAKPPTIQETILFCANQRGGRSGTIAYLAKAVMRLVQDSVENEGVCFVS